MREALVFLTVQKVMSRGMLRVPHITVMFWLIKALTTALGESTSDYLVHAISPVGAVALGFCAFVGGLALQFRMRRYVPWTYWFTVAMVGVFGTMAADVLHVGFHVPYIASALLYAAALIAVFAMGTALGDLTATTFHLGYFRSAVLFAALIAVPAVGYFRFRWSPILSFWLAYVATRPLGASLADWMGKPVSKGGLGWGDGPVALVLAVAILCGVGYLAGTGRDAQPSVALDSW